MTVRVLIVEDSRQLRTALAEMLQGLGAFEVVGEADTEAEARLWVEEHPSDWDFAVIDLVLAQGTGMGVVSKCRQVSAEAKVVVFSDYATAGIKRHCLQLGADAVFQKNHDVPAFARYCEALASGAAQPPMVPDPY